MRVRCLNSALAAAFIGGLHTHSPENVSIELELCLCDLPKRGHPLVLDITPEVEDEMIMIELSEEAGYDRYINTGIGLEQLVDEVLRPFFGAALPRVKVYGHDAVITRDQVQVGCKSFTRADMDRIRLAQHRVLRNLKFKEFRTERGHLIRSGGSSRITIDGDGVVTMDELTQVFGVWQQAQSAVLGTGAFVPFKLLA